MTCKVKQAISGWFTSMVADFVNSGLTGAAVGLLTTTPLTQGIEASWHTALGVANACFVVVVTVAGIVAMTRPTVQSSTGVAEVLPRLVLGFVGANASWFLCQQMSTAGNAVSKALLGQAATPDNVAQSIARILENPQVEGLIIIQLALMASVLGIVFMFTVVIRAMLWILLSAAAPIALALHALPQTEGVARLWWRAMGALLLIQLAQALTLRVIVTLFLTRDGISAMDPLGSAGSIIDVLVLVACLYVLIRIPFWGFKRVFNYQRSPLVKGAKLAASLLIFRSIGAAVASQRAGTAATAAARTPRATGQTWQYRPAQRPTWHQPELPHAWPRVPRGRQEALPGIDAQIDPAEQHRAQQRRRWVQLSLPMGRPSSPTPPRRYSQDPIAGMERRPPPTGRQDPLPGMHKDTMPAARQDALFAPTSAMRRPPSNHVPGQRPHERAQQSSRIQQDHRHVPHPAPPSQWVPLSPRRGPGGAPRGRGRRTQ